MSTSLDSPCRITTLDLMMSGCLEFDPQVPIAESVHPGSRVVSVVSVVSVEEKEFPARPLAGLAIPSGKCRVIRPESVLARREPGRAWNASTKSPTTLRGHLLSCSPIK